ncbi:glycosyltransferase family 4 protein [Haloferax sulfurifontis]|uniref:Glycosyl transferase family protein n=1 Tax=Haloferax sulfurifontis ATCC BAA-897 TaxID=662480 RepID=M0IP97_9EURY|nr:glycosyltransferase family 4 protein [Haloferax sulfurifontis]ELZ98646.1 glycosyl transferase family protein [Haloferax sulfurifontis ATCC BAA-897]
MRVALVVYGPLDGRSGGYRYDTELVRGLRAAGDDVTVVSLPERPYRKRFRDNLTAVRRLRDLDADVLLQDELCHPSLVGPNALLADDVPVVSVVHHLHSLERFRWWRRRARRAVERRYLRSADAFVFNSETTKRTVAAVTDPDPSVVAYPAGDRFSSFGAPLGADEIRARAADGALRIVTVCNLEPRKNVDGLLRGLARVRGDWELTVVGAAVDADYADSLSDLAVDRDIDDRVTFAGRLSDADLAAALRASHLFALPSHYEGFGIAAVEAMGFGLPALVSSAGGASELVTHRENGFLVDPTDSAEITDAVSPLCRNRRRLQSLSLSARDRFLAHPTWDETAAAIRSFLCDIVGDADAASHPNRD